MRSLTLSIVHYLSECLVPLQVPIASCTQPQVYSAVHHSAKAAGKTPGEAKQDAYNARKQRPVMMVETCGNSPGSCSD